MHSLRHAARAIKRVRQRHNRSTETMAQGLPPIRRVVTGHDANEVAKVLIDGPAGNARTPMPGLTTTLIWCTFATPADIAVGETIEDMGERKLGPQPPPNGSRFTVIDFAPGNKAVMHRTESIDYVMVLSGTIDMDMDDSTVTLRAGDVLVQRGTNHAWANRSDAPARVAFVLIDAEPLGIGHAVPFGEVLR
jgi:quercetin dioxygenase-like cupin family protein